jgi:hypothetical protein
LRLLRRFPAAVRGPFARDLAVVVAFDAPDTVVLPFPLLFFAVMNDLDVEA